MNYTIKVWLFTVLIAPLIIVFIWEVFTYPLDQNSMWDFWTLLGFMVLFGFFLSIPAMVVFGLILRLTVKYLNNRVKLILSFYSFTSVWISFYIIGFVNGDSRQILWMFIYSLTIVLGVWIFRLPIRFKV